MLEPTTTESFILHWDYLKIGEVHDSTFNGLDGETKEV